MSKAKALQKKQEDKKKNPKTAAVGGIALAQEQNQELLQIAREISFAIEVAMVS